MHIQGKSMPPRIILRSSRTQNIDALNLNEPINNCKFTGIVCFPVLFSVNTTDLLQSTMVVRKVDELREFFKSHNKTKEQKAHSAKVKSTKRLLGFLC